MQKRKRNQINMHHFENVQINIVDELPWEIDGVKIYKKTSTMNLWWDETKDGKWWKVSDSSQSTLNGERKFLTCTGSCVCNNPNSSKLTSEGVIISSRQKVEATLATCVGTMYRRTLWCYENFGI